jgi:hypothetical protein
MRDEEIVLLAEPSKEHQELIVQASSEDAIPARIVAITNVEPGNGVIGKFRMCYRFTVSAG